ncbi:MAG: tRNA (guanosine(37)-N1)-methyltransferase TrmD [Candidatus Eutrophobiaceae bacterium]
MQIDLITLFPHCLEILPNLGVTGRALEKGLLEVRKHNPRDYASGKQRKVDDRPFGGGPGMVMMYEPLHKAIQVARRQNPEALVICLSPSGRRLDQMAVRRFAMHKGLILVAGRYAGIDQRLLDNDVDEQWSVGDYVLSGGELPALILIDALARILPKALGNEDSVGADSFHAGLLGYPQYTRPETLPEEGRGVPKVLLGGNHAEIDAWRMRQSLGHTWLLRPDLLEQLELSAQQIALLSDFQSQCGVPKDRDGNTSDAISSKTKKVTI